MRSALLIGENRELLDRRRGLLAKESIDRTRSTEIMFDPVDAARDGSPPRAEPVDPVSWDCRQSAEQP